MVGKAGAESEAGEQDAGRITESQARKTGQVYSQDRCSMVPTLTARAPGLCSGGWTLWWRCRLPESPQPWGWEQLPAIVLPIHPAILLLGIFPKNTTAKKLSDKNTYE